MKYQEPIVLRDKSGTILRPPDGDLRPRIEDDKKEAKPQAVK